MISKAKKCQLILPLLLSQPENIFGDDHSNHICFSFPYLQYLLLDRHSTKIKDMHIYYGSKVDAGLTCGSKGNIETNFYYTDLH